MARNKNKKKSLIWTISATEFKSLFDKHFTLKDILTELELDAAGGNYRALKARIQEEELDFDTFEAKRKEFINEQLRGAYR